MEVTDMVDMAMVMADTVMNMAQMVMIAVMPMKITNKVKKALVKKMTKDMATTAIKKGLDMVTVDIDMAKMDPDMGMADQDLATVDTGMFIMVTDMAMDMVDT